MQCEKRSKLGCIAPCCNNSSIHIACAKQCITQQASEWDHFFASLLTLHSVWTGLWETPVRPAVGSCLQDIKIHRLLPTGFLYPCELDRSKRDVRGAWCGQFCASYTFLSRTFFLHHFSTEQFCVVALEKRVNNISSRPHLKTQSKHWCTEITFSTKITFSNLISNLYLFSRHVAK